MRIRPEEASDRAGVRAVHEAAFGGAAEADLVDALRGAPGSVSLVAELEGRVVGHLLLSLAQVDDGPILALAPMGVLPDFQRRGVGSALVRAALEAVGDADVVVLGHPGFYPRFGFVPARALGVLPPFEVPDEAWMVRLGRPRHGTVRYPPAFDKV
ncbi:MAG: N-acetyltransferase [Candidatus Eremiobacterota bacterium]